MVFALGADIDSLRVMSVETPTVPLRDLTEINREFYDALWADTYVERPERFNTWPLVKGLLPQSSTRLEVGPGLRPRLPVAGTHFIDLSAAAVGHLNARGGHAALGNITALPFDEGHFDLVAAFDVIEHVADDRQVFSELARVLKPGGVLLCAVPLHAAHWTTFDAYVGHARRYDPAVLCARLSEYGFTIEQSAVFGMQSNNPRLLDYGVKMLTRHRQRAMSWYNRVFMPLGMWFQKKLKFTPGLMNTDRVHEVALVCRRG
jgi:SAM-dependent methyltransferase